MKISMKNAWRAVGLMAALILLQASTGVSLEDASRDSADCIKVCNAVRDKCRVECVTDCSALFPPGVDQDLCIDTCWGVCTVEKQECKAKCNVRKNPPCPHEP